MLKADAYGLGAAPVGRALARAGCRDFFVATLDEGLALRAALAAPTHGPSSGSGTGPGSGALSGPRVFVLQGLLPGMEGDMAASGLIPVLNSLDEIARWRTVAGPGGGRADVRRPCAIHLDTGMNRLGLEEREADILAAGADQLLDGLEVVLWLSHLACGDHADTPMNAAQDRRLRRMLARLPTAPVSLAASSGMFRGEALRHDLTRPGAALFGINPTPGQANPLRPVLRWRARVVQVRMAPAGDTIGYGATHAVAAATPLATLGAGYADGYPRALAGRGHVMLPGPRGDTLPGPVAGRISMDLTSVIVPPGIDPASLTGAWADLIGPGRDLDDLAADAGTIGYEILTGLGPRVVRVYQGQETE